MRHLEEAVEKALRIRESALNTLLARDMPRNNEEELEAMYRYFRERPDELVAFAAQNVGPARALEEARRFLAAMERKYGTGHPEMAQSSHPEMEEEPDSWHSGKLEERSWHQRMGKELP